MIKKESFSLEHINSLRLRKNINLLLLERSIYAMGLLEALLKTGMPLIFKGGSSLMLLLDKPRRLSTDIDVIVEPGTDVQHYIEEASKIFPFVDVEKQIRTGKNNIEKRHYKFTYNSPVNKEPFYILLDIVFDENHYSHLTSKPIKNELLITEEPYYEVKVPTAECILGDKLTAFAPHTTGIRFGEDKELEIIKQMYDIACLFEAATSFDDVYKSYMATVEAEIAYRGEPITFEDALNDTIETASCIAGKGKIGTEYPLLLSGIKGLVNHVYNEKFSGETAAFDACKVLYVAACILKNIPFKKIENPALYATENLGRTRFNKLGFMKKVNLEAFSYVVEAEKILSEK